MKPLSIHSALPAILIGAVLAASSSITPAGAIYNARTPPLAGPFSILPCESEELKMNPATQMPPADRSLATPSNAPATPSNMKGNPHL